MTSRTEGNKHSGVNKDRQVYEAVAAVEEVFRKRGIAGPGDPVPICVESDNRFN
jgi:hypothetical protein